MQEPKQSPDAGPRCLTGEAAGSGTPRARNTATPPPREKQRALNCSSSHQKQRWSLSSASRNKTRAAHAPGAVLSTHALHASGGAKRGALFRDIRALFRESRGRPANVRLLRLRHFGARACFSMLYPLSFQSQREREKGRFCPPNLLEPARPVATGRVGSRRKRHDGIFPPQYRASLRKPDFA